MRVLVVLALLAVAVAAVDVGASPRSSKKGVASARSSKKSTKEVAAPASNKPARRCDKGWVQVGQGLCCPRDHSVLIDGTCYEHCHGDSDDMVLGAWVGCRELCDPGYDQSINACAKGILSSERKDHQRDGKAPKAQRSIASITEATISACEKGLVKVKGGCCPKDKPKLIAGHCYGGCEQGKEELVIGAFVGCRAACAEGWDQHNNHCSKDHHDDTDRGDFPRYGDVPHERVVIPTPKHDKDDGCGNGYVRASKHYCCPATDPVLKGLLCYARCKTGFEESGYGCREKCRAGWSESVLQCGKGAKSYRRKGYERSPKPSKLRI